MTAALQDVMTSLAAISLDEVLDEAELQTRKDRKYLIPIDQVPTLLERLDPGSRVLEIDGRREFRYASTYFDTPSLVSYLDAARRRPQRFKVRTRRYLDTETCQVEVKMRDGRGHTIKHRHDHPVDQPAVLGPLARVFIAQFPLVAGHAMDLRPTLSTSYQRVTIVLPGSPARVTVDTDVLFRSHLADTTVGLGPLALIETKTTGPASTFDRTLWQQGHRPHRISKFGTGLAALHPSLPANKWNRVLRTRFDWAPACKGSPA